MKVVVVSRRFRPLIGGAESILWQLGRELVRQGCEVTVCTARWERGWLRHERVDGVAIERFTQPRRRFLGTLQYIVLLERWLLKHGKQYDLCYTSMLKHSAWACLGAARRIGFPVVLRPEGAGETGDIHWHTKARFGRIIRRRCRSAAGAVALSETIEKELRGAGFPSYRIHYIPNGVPVVRESAADQRSVWKQRLGLPAGDPVVLYLGRLSAEKGVSDLVEAWKLVDAAVPNARLLLVGAGPEEARLREMSRSLASVVFPGATTMPDRFLRAADLFVLPSHHEGLSIALLEAGVRQLPIVASDIAQNTAVFDRDTEAWFVPVGQPAALAEMITRRLAHPHEGARLGAAARERVVRDYSIEQVARRHLQLFESLVKQ